MLEKIEAILDEQVRPYLISHGGNLRTLGYEGGVLHLQMQGACAGCPAADITTEQVILEALRAELPDIRVDMQSYISPALLAQAREILCRGKR